MLTKDTILYKKAFAFAVRVVKLQRYLLDEKKEFVLSKQLLRSGTSIGANISEANGAISPSDFSSKISIAYKESLETKYWLSLLKETEFITESARSSLHKDADELSKILFSILRTTRLKSFST
ncbi:MAG: four helix bundle protein [Bacteroidota bacterium]